MRASAFFVCLSLMVLLGACGKDYDLRFECRGEQVYLNGEPQWIHPSESWQEITNGMVIDSLKIDPNFYVRNMK